jgi:beta-fructofuranosidase
MLYLRDRWIWDSWPIDDGDDHHLFYLQAPRSIGDPDMRHWQATVGHAVSTDYEHWTVLPDALRPSAGPAWDDLAIWTGSVVRGDSGTWHLFYTAISAKEGGRVQRIGRADSDDLVTWRRYADGPLVQADPRWYETMDMASWREEAWRDPWVLRDPAGDGWHMLITARVRTGPRLARGVIGHARSADLERWTVQPPLTGPAGFGQMEVSQVAMLDGRAVLTFCCVAADLSEERRRATPEAGMWSASGTSLLGPFDVENAVPLADPTLYAAHLVGLGTDRPALLGFGNKADGVFAGAICPPVPVRLAPDGTLAELRVDTELPTDEAARRPS